MRSHKVKGIEWVHPILLSESGLRLYGNHSQHTKPYSYGFTSILDNPLQDGVVKDKSADSLMGKKLEVKDA